MKRFTLLFRYRNGKVLHDVVETIQEKSRAAAVKYAKNKAAANDWRLVFVDEVR